jgi:hypothetical protein
MKTKSKTQDVSVIKMVTTGSNFRNETTYTVVVGLEMLEDISLAQLRSLSGMLRSYIRRERRVKS